MAQSTATSTNSVPTTGQYQLATPEQRKERMEHLLKALDLTKEDIKGLTPKEKQAKLKETAQTVVSDLKAKQTSGALTAEGQKRLTFLEKYLAEAGHKKTAAASSN
jgi:hypothetical protein